MSSKEDLIAIIGSGYRFPGNASSPSTLWGLLSKPTVVASEIPSDRFSNAGFYHSHGDYHGHTNVKEAYFLADSDAHRSFDASFFGMNAIEASVLDPQIRLLLEKTYEALEAAGLRIKDLEGSDTAVYVGQMMSDYETIMQQDPELMGRYHATGTSRAMTANRLSYFFDWRGPSMTIDTACSSSLIAVHEAVQQLRSRRSRTAVAAGVNLILDSTPFISESKLQMLSPDGRSKMWDAKANGYARGEGIAAVVLKRLVDAEADNDHIDCIIRETSVNQDGKTSGITMPSAAAQAALIRDCYRRAGLDIRNPDDRPQYFEAHGTGTQAGDAAEAEALNTAFFSDSGREESDALTMPPSSALLVGSIKTVVGHTEGAAGLAGIIKTSLALEHATIPPNLLFEQLNPRILPFYGDLRIPCQPEPWPSVSSGNPRRASVNSFGFGGMNAHAILESYNAIEAFPAHDKSGSVYTPFVFTAASETSLESALVEFRSYIRQNAAEVHLQDLSHTLHTRRTRLPVGIAIACTSTDELCSELDQRIEDFRAGKNPSIRTKTPYQEVGSYSAPSILGVFTGQGAQWAGMGLELVQTSEACKTIIQRLDDRLARLPEKDRPEWSLVEELGRVGNDSRVNEAMISQPICTAIQILQVALLEAAGIRLTAVVGHSSGEIAAAYAAGRISADDAICIAYYRGLCSSRSSGPGGESGAMMAVATSVDDIQELLSEPEFRGRVCIAAINSQASLTVSGDQDAIHFMKTILDDEGKTTHILKVDKAYHSHHMEKCSVPYLEALSALDIQIQPSSQCAWFSSVYGGEQMSPTDDRLTGPYWVSNMRLPVLFEQAVNAASEFAGPFDLGVEIGPHPALKRAVLDSLPAIPYTNISRRGVAAIRSCSEGLGYAWIRLGENVVKLNDFDKFMTGGAARRLVKGLPSYCWDHNHKYWHESRQTRAYRHRQDPVHELLGHITADSTEHDRRWRQILRPSEVSWLTGHKLQDQIVFPAAGYVAMAVEASVSLCRGTSVSLIEISDLEFERALTFEDEGAAVEMLFSLANITTDSEGHIDGIFRCHAASVRAEDNSLKLHAHGRLRVLQGEPRTDTLPERVEPQPNLLKLSENQFYESIRNLEYQYTGPFAALNNLERKLGFATGSIQADTLDPSTYMIHPAILDAAFQSVLLVHAAPGDGELRAMHVPRRITRLSVNAQICTAARSETSALSFDSVCPHEAIDFRGDIDIYPGDGVHPMVQIENLECVPLSQTTDKDDRALFSAITWEVMEPNAHLAALDGLAVPDSPEAVQIMRITDILERVAGFFLRELDNNFAAHDPARVEGPYRYLFNFASHTISLARSGDLPRWRQEWEADTYDDVLAASEPHMNTIEVKFLHCIGRELADIVRGRKLAIQVGMRDNMLAEVYSRGLGAASYTKSLARIVRQLTHRYPAMDILEVGAGTGVATTAVLSEIEERFTSYCFTDISTGFFEQAKTHFNAQGNRMRYQALDISQDPVTQDFAEESFDLVIASLVLHATPSLKRTLQNIRRLLKPGGHLVVLELLPSHHTWIGVVFGAFLGWWVGADEGRVLSPAASTSDWDNLLRCTGFSGCDTETPVHEELNNLKVFVSQAVDEKIEFLRDPLFSSCRPSSGPIMDNLLVLGGDSLHTRRLLGPLRSLLGPHCRSFTNVTKLTELSSVLVSNETTVISMADIDSPLFKNMNDEAWSSVRELLLKASTLIWVTSGRRADQPFANMMLGMLRSAVREVNIDYLSLDFEDITMLDDVFLSQAVLRHIAGTTYRRQQELHVTVEPEIVLDRHGRAIIPRMYPSRMMNDRYNSARRPIFQKPSPAASQDVILAQTGAGYELQQAAPLRPRAEETGHSVHNTHALLAAIRVASCGFMFLTIGKQNRATDNLVTLSTTHTPVTYPLSGLTTAVQIPSGSESRFLVLVAYHMIVFATLDYLCPGHRILIHEPNSDFAAIMAAEGRLAQVQVIFTSEAEIPKAKEQHWVRVQAGMPERSLRKVLPGNFALLLDLSDSKSGDAVARRIHAAIRGGPRFLDRWWAFSNETSTPSSAQVSEIAQRLQKAVSSACISLRSEGAGNDSHGSAISLESLVASGRKPPPVSVVDWASLPNASLRVQPMVSLVNFSDKKTYWLAGLSGGLGLSLCEWMVHRGARYIVINSRRPNIPQSWLDSMTAVGAYVKVAACDMSQRSQLATLYDEIRLTMPAIAGVVQGAMVLRDEPVERMSLEDVMQVCGPKVQGSIHLNDLFQEDNLDFFIFLSSLISLVGNPGQANYAAANMFMASLAEQRRQRGLAASVVHIGSIFGIGVITKGGYSTPFRPSVLRQAGLMPLSERDFRHIFAEGVAAGEHTPYGIDHYAGLRAVTRDDESPPGWIHDPIMSHYVINSGRDTRVVAGGSRAGMSIRAQLAQAQDLDQIYGVVRNALLPNIHAVFQLDPVKYPGNIVEATRFDEMGIDSLLAVEVRSWLVKNFDVNIPVLKILSGIMVSDLIRLVCSQIPAALVPKLKPVTSSQSANDDMGVIRDPNVEPLSIEQDLPNEENWTDDSASETRVTEYQSSVGDETSITPSVSNTTGHSVQSTLSGAVLAEACSDDCNSLSTVQSFRLSFAQEMFWFVWKYQEDKTSLNHVIWARISGTLRIQALREAVNIVGQQNSILRTRFFEHEGKPFQELMRTGPLRLEHHENVERSMVSSMMRSAQRHIFDLERGETVRVMLLSHSPTEHVLLVTLLPLSLDGTSTQIFLNQIAQQYQKLNCLTPSRPFTDFSEQQHIDYENGEMEDDVRFWRAQLEPSPPPLPILTLSRCTKREPLTNYENQTVGLRISKEVKARVQSVCRQHRTTPFHFYLAVLRALLVRFTNDAQDVTIGVADANRDEESMGVMGPFVNFLPVRLPANASEPFDCLLERARNGTYAALQHSKVPLQVLLSRLEIPRSTTHSPIFQCCINYRQGQVEEMQLGSEATIQILGLDVKLGYDLYLEIVDIPGGESVQTLIVREDLYGREEAACLANCYKTLLESFANDPAGSLGGSAMFADSDTSKALQFGQGPSFSSQWRGTLVDRVDEVVQMRSQEPAIIQEGGTLTYQGMATRACAVATALQSFQVVPGSVVAVLQEPTANWIASLLGIMRLGSVYVPMDPGMPTGRLSSILDDCRPLVALVDSQTESLIARCRHPDLTVVNVSTLEEVSNIPNASSSSERAAILYTSGSTGAPKGVVLTHRGLVNWAEPIASLYDLKHETVLQQTSPTFDLSLVQILTALCFGGSLYLVPRHQRGDAYAIPRIMSQHHITFTCATPSEYSTWLMYDKTHLLKCSGWRTAFSAGESIPKGLLKRFASLKNERLRLYNLYGPTETSLAATATNVTYQCLETLKPQSVVAAGRPLPNYSVYVLDAQCRLVPPQVQGEVYISGAGVGLGYLHQAEQTARAFVPDPFFKGGKGRLMHKTGDIGRWQADGALVIEGRVSGDTQVKLRGLRIDLREIERAITAEADDGAILDAVVSIRSSCSGSVEATDFLVAHVVFDPLSHQPSHHEAALAVQSRVENLPQYMWPAAVVPVTKLPTTISGKLDRLAAAALPVPVRASAKPDHPKMTELNSYEVRLGHIWSEVLSEVITDLDPRITLQTDFFHIGGNSLLLLVLHARIKDAFSVELPIVRMFEHSTLAAMARQICNAEKQDHKSSGADTSDHDPAIDWDAETQLQPFLLNLGPQDLDPVPPTLHPRGKIVVLTGATGHLGHALLAALTADPAVGRVHCIAVRKAGSRADIDAALRHNEKVVLHQGDLMLPRLGLPEDEALRIMSAADVVIHNAADVSLTKTYSSLRVPNLQSTRQLAELCATARRMVPIHYVSTISVGSIAARSAAMENDKCNQSKAPEEEFVFGPVSVADHKPETTPRPRSSAASAVVPVAHGYVASKWASEVFLERLHRHFGRAWPVYIHRPSVIDVAQGDVAENGPGKELVHNIRYYSSLLRAVPALGGGAVRGGVVDIVSLEQVVGGVLGPALARGSTSALVSRNAPLADVCQPSTIPCGTETGHRTARVEILHHVGGVELAMDDVSSWKLLPVTNSDRGATAATSADEGVQMVREVEIGEWARRAEEIGMDASLLMIIRGMAPGGVSEPLLFPKVVGHLPN